MFDPATVDIEKSRTTAAEVGCDGGSFVVAYLRNALKILPENTVTVYSEDPENSLTSSCKRLASEPDDDPGVAPEATAAAEPPAPAATTELSAGKQHFASHLQKQLEKQNQQHQPWVQQIDS
ncbi:hypothetical protein OIU84_027055 [Salix udensis]|uniref:Uncharacterized protein n=1 Tax=Salix udensis TaxID=889485 RepID=A0AAD6KG08_9ROSI|nr:hypothetical protein OIU84_027055 [Salix udensis]